MTRIATVVKGYPRLSETFIAQEILGLEQRGIDQVIISLRHPHDPFQHDLNREITAEVLYLPEYLKDDPRRVRAGRAHAQSLPGYALAEEVFQSDLKRDRSISRRRRWGQACVLARELPDDVNHLHTHFLHTPASVTRYAAIMRGIGWSFSAHAKDIWTSPRWELTEKIADADWGATCTNVNAQYLRQLANGKTPIDLVYHGLALDRFPSPKSEYSLSAGDHSDPVQLLSVGRLVEKKGYDDLLHALARLPDNLDWHFTHIGGGGLSGRLEALAERLRIADHITWRGALPRDGVIAACLASDLFVLPCKITASGDRDGLPNVLMEAAALGLPVVSTKVSAVAELVGNRMTGLLVEPGDRTDLAAALQKLIEEPMLRQKLGAAGAKDVAERFSCAPGIDHLAARLREAA